MSLNFCEGYTEDRIRSDGQNIRNVASEGTTYIVWLYADQNFSQLNNNDSTYTDESNEPVTFDNFDYYD